MKRKYPKKLPGGVKFTKELKYKFNRNYIEYLKEYQRLLIKENDTKT